MQFILFRVIHYCLQQVFVYFKFYYFDVFIMLKPLPLETCRVISVYSRNKKIRIFFTFPWVVIEHRHWHFHKALNDISSLFKHLSFGILFIVFVLGGPCWKLQSVAMNWSPELHVHQNLWFFVMVFDYRDYIY